MRKPAVDPNETVQRVGTEAGSGEENKWIWSPPCLPDYHRDALPDELQPHASELWAATNITNGHLRRKNGLTTGAGLANRARLKYNPRYDTRASEHCGGSVYGDFAGAGVWKQRRGRSHAIARANGHGYPNSHAHADSHPYAGPDTNADPVCATGQMGDT